MTKNELLELAEKIKNNLATDEERLVFFQELNSLIKEVDLSLKEQNI